MQTSFSLASMAKACGGGGIKLGLEFGADGTDEVESYRSCPDV